MTKTPDNQQKIFCTDCKHFKDPFAAENCIHPKNLEDTWKEPGGECVGSPTGLNRDNDCTWYEAKESISINPDTENPQMNKIAEARKTIRDVFEKDPEFKQGYVANIAMLLHDYHGITDYHKRNQAAEDILELIFSPAEKRSVDQKKVFCIDCKHIITEPYECDHPGNHANSWLKPNGIHWLLPEAMNKHNSCKWYEQSEEKNRRVEYELIHNRSNTSIKSEV